MTESSRSGMLDRFWQFDAFSELYDGECTYLSPRLAVAAFGSGDYVQYLSDLDASLEQAGRWSLYNLNSSLTPADALPGLQHKVFQRWYPRTACNMPTLQALLTTCCSIMSIIEPPHNQTVVLHCVKNAPDLKGKVPLILVCLTMWEWRGADSGRFRASDDHDVIIQAALVHVSSLLSKVMPGWPRISLSASQLRYASYVAHILASRSFPTVRRADFAADRSCGMNAAALAHGPLELELIIGDSLPPSAGAAQNEAGARLQLLVQVFKGRMLVWSNAGTAEKDTETLRQTGLLRVVPSSQGSQGSSVIGGRACHIEGDVVIRFSSQPVPDSNSTSDGGLVSPKPFNKQRFDIEYGFHTAMLEKENWERGTLNLKVSGQQMDTLGGDPGHNELGFHFFFSRVDVNMARGSHEHAGEQMWLPALVDALPVNDLPSDVVQPRWVRAQTIVTCQPSFPSVMTEMVNMAAEVSQHRARSSAAIALADIDRRMDRAARMDGLIGRCCGLDEDEHTACKFSIVTYPSNGQTYAKFFAASQRFLDENVPREATQLGKDTLRKSQGPTSDPQVQLIEPIIELSAANEFKEHTSTTVAHEGITDLDVISLARQQTRERCEEQAVHTGTQQIQDDDVLIRQTVEQFKRDPRILAMMGPKQAR